MIPVKDYAVNRILWSLPSNHFKLTRSLTLDKRTSSLRKSILLYASLLENWCDGNSDRVLLLISGKDLVSKSAK